MVVGVQDSIILDGAVLADDDISVVRAYYCSRPDTCAFPDDHVTDYVSSFANESRRVYTRAFAI